MFNTWEHTFVFFWMFTFILEKKKKNSPDPESLCPFLQEKKV